MDFCRLDLCSSDLNPRHFVLTTSRLSAAPTLAFEVHTSLLQYAREDGLGSLPLAGCSTVQFPTTGSHTSCTSERFAAEPSSVTHPLTLRTKGHKYEQFTLGTLQAHALGNYKVL